MRYHVGVGVTDTSSQSNTLEATLWKAQSSTTGGMSSTEFFFGPLIHRVTSSEGARALVSSGLRWSESLLRLPNVAPAIQPMTLSVLWKWKTLRLKVPPLDASIVTKVAYYLTSWGLSSYRDAELKTEHILSLSDQWIVKHLKDFTGNIKDMRFFIRIFTMLKKNRAARWVSQQVLAVQIEFIRALHRFLRAAYRAHIARKVRPLARPLRLPRPLYAQPRPPSAPLAPPLR